MYRQKKAQEPPFRLRSAAGHEAKRQLCDFRQEPAARLQVCILQEVALTQVEYRNALDYLRITL